jgi:hypothetical protein
VGAGALRGKGEQNYDCRYLTGRTTAQVANLNRNHPLLALHSQSSSISRLYASRHTSKRNKRYQSGYLIPIVCFYGSPPVRLSRSERNEAAADAEIISNWRALARRAQLASNLPSDNSYLLTRRQRRELELWMAVGSQLRSAFTSIGDSKVAQMDGAS